MILFIGQVGSDFVEREAFQEIDYRRMFGQMAKWVAQIDRADRIPEFIARAYQVATSGRMGPVVLALPEDMLSATATVADARATSSSSMMRSPDSSSLPHHRRRRWRARARGARDCRSASALASANEVITTVSVPARERGVRACRSFISLQRARGPLATRGSVVPLHAAASDRHTVGRPLIGNRMKNVVPLPS